LVGCLFSKFVGLVIPIPQQPIVGEAAKNILNIIFCLFEKIIDRLLPYLEDMLQGLVGRALNAPLCAIEEFTAVILNKLIETIDELLEPILSGVDWLVGGISKISSILSTASSVATQIFNLIGCDNLKCKEPSEWALNVGPTKVEADNWNRVVNKMNVIKGFNDNLDVSLNNLSIFGGGNTPIFRDCSDRTNNPQSQKDLVRSDNKYPVCIPPEVEIYGDGIGASAVAVIGENGSIISIEILNSGFGYTEPPAVSIIDKSNYGFGAKATSIIQDGKVSQIYLTSSGSGYCNTDLNNIVRKPYYIITSNRYSLYEGESCAITILGQNVKDGTQLKYIIGGDITENDIEGPLFGSITMFEGKATLEIKTIQDKLNETLERLTFDLYDTEETNVARLVILINDINSPLVVVDPPQDIPKIENPSDFTNSGPNTGIVEDIIITSPGIGYTPGDVIRFGNCIAYPIISPSGSIVGISSIICSDEFTTLPIATINSNIGEGAEVFPILKFTPKESIKPVSIINDTGIIKVIDCI